MSVLGQVVADPDRRVDTLALPGHTELHQLTREAARGPRRDFGGATPLVRFARQAARTPERVAFRHGPASLSYADLADRAARLAGRLHRLGVTTETPVGVCLPHGLDLPAAALGVWRADGAYLPLDPASPPERLAWMLADSGAPLVVTTTALRPLLPAGTPVLLLDADPRGWAALTEDPPGAPRSTLDSLAAVIYTSGSTGRPKGVAVTGRALVNRVEWFAAECPPGPGEVGALKTPIAFVDSLWELLGGLLHGVPTVVVQTGPSPDPRALVEALAQAGVTRLLLVPTLLRMLLLTCPDLPDRLPDLRLWISSGEPLPADLARDFLHRMPGRVLHNLYGSAEGWDSLWPPACDPGVAGPGPVPVGRPLANVTAHVLDRAGQPAPVGVTGELYVGGECLARGYLGRPDLTADRFVPDPWRSGARLYRTGDLARVRPDGQVDLLGRADDQVKIRGFRVEPGEVERALRTLPRVRQAAVVARRRPCAQEPELAAYLVCEGEPTPAELRAGLAGLLPTHLVPSTFTLLPALPVTVTGKVDRRALPEPTAPAPGPVADPADEGERRLAALWAEVLGVARIGVHDDFFDVGGHSLLAAQLVTRVGQEVGRDLPLRTVFDHPTVHRMAAALRAAG
jgi:amino acid adenylation domain-containing protein